MAESACREGSTRRQSFRKNLEAAGLPDDDLDRLELKRKQLDESIHKYIAAKEREYKSFEKELIQRHKLGLPKDGQGTRRASAESNGDARLQDRQQNQTQNAVDALLSAGIRRDQIGQPVPIAVVDDDGTSPTLEARPSMAGLTDRRASLERDKEFIGVFTPAFLPALADSRGSASPERAESAPPAASSADQTQPVDGDGMQRASSDSFVQARARRPIHLQLNHRTSSSGSSENGNGKLPSALKSPTHRPRKKRVSLAINDTIVAPSDNVPESFPSNNSIPSHSRTRSPAAEREPAKLEKPTSPPKDSPQQAESTTAPFSPLTQATMMNAFNKTEIAREQQRVVQQELPLMPSPSKAKAPPKSSPKTQAAIDGDLEFALDDDDVLSPADARPPNPLESGDEGIAGRVSRTDPGDELYDSSEGPFSEGGEESDDHAEHLEFKPSSVQQTNSAGFRRPSANHDPVYEGRNYARAERSAVNNETYGSSYIRPSSKGSFNPGSLGESFMAQNAERIMRSRNARESAQVRS